MDKKSIKYWDTVGKGWHRTHPQWLWRTHCDWVNGKLIKCWMTPDYRQAILKTDLFDEACSEGIIAYFSTLSESIYGIDISRSITSSAQFRYPELMITCGDVCSLPFTDSRFDAVISNSTLDHFISSADFELSLKEIIRVLRPGGELILTMDNILNPIILIRNLLPYRLLKYLGIVPYFVGKTYRPGRLKQILENSGMAVFRTESIMHCPRAIMVFLAKHFQKRTSLKFQECFSKFLRHFEKLARWPTRFFTGHYIAVHAFKKE